MPLIDPADDRPIHFMGIAGAGMSALAELLVRRGARVTGCDAQGDATGDFGRLGISVARGHDASMSPARVRSSSHPPCHEITQSCSRPAHWASR